MICSSIPGHYLALVIWLLPVWLLAACSPAGNPASEPAATAPAAQEVVVFAAASLTDAFTEMAQAFEAENPGTVVTFNFGSSSQLATQLVEGGQADVFASANERQMAVAIEGGRVVETASTPFVSNRLAVVVPADNPAGITRLEDLSRPGILLVLAVPGVPVRDYTDVIVERLGSDFSEGFYANAVSEEENVRQVLAKVALGEADAGIVYTSDVTPDVAGQVQQIAIPDEQNEIASYPIAPIADAPHAELAGKLITFVLSDAGQGILSEWGFGPPVP